MATVVELLTRVAAFEHGAAEAVKALEDIQGKLRDAGIEAEVVAAVADLKSALDGLLHAPTAMGQARQEQPGVRAPVANPVPMGEHAPGGDPVSVSGVQPAAAEVEATERAAQAAAAEDAAAKDAEAKAAADEADKA